MAEDSGVDIPPADEYKEGDLEDWFRKKKELAQLKWTESILRKKLVKHFFGTDAPEGTNTHLLPDGYQLKGIIVISRDVDEGVLEVNKKRFSEMKIPVTKLVKYKPELVKSEYNKLTPDQKQAFDECLVIKEGSPQLDIKPPSVKA